MKLKNFISNKKSVRLISVLLIVFCIAAIFGATVLTSNADTVTTIDNTDEVKALMSEATSFILVRHKQLGGSHYAYTEGVSDDSGEVNFTPGSMLCLVTLSVDDKNPDKVKVSEKVLLRSPNGVIRDPDVSEDGTRVLFSHKTSSNDDFHLYEMEIATKKTTQLTFGSGVADIEPVYAGNGTIIFNSTRDIQTVDCWYTPVSNLYICNADGSNITRVGYDQVHTTYPTATTDGRILYTRWDYNDRNQMYIQALFQMFPDGTGQTELFGNNSNNPSTLLHTREVPGNSEKYITIVSGHHMYQVGKLAIIDTSKGRNGTTPVSYVRQDNATRSLANQSTQSVDNTLFQQGDVYKYPYAISENLFLVSMCKNYNGDRSAPFDIVLMNSKGKYQTLVKNQADYPASQFVPIKSEELFTRSSMVSYAEKTGTYYVADVYQGEPMKGIERGTIKYLRVVALSFRPYAIGATNGYGTGSADPYSPIATGNGSWDVKQVLGIVPVEEDGSALFSVPSETPVYFQLLNENGDMIQTMRSWSTLQPGEYFSCVGCHLDKNSAPPTSLTVTDAMKKGVQELQPDLWMSVADEYKDFDPYTDEYIGFDYLSVVQPILDSTCVTCHSNTQDAFKRISIGDLNDSERETERANTVFETNEEWNFTKATPSNDWTSPSFDDSEWSTSFAPFGQVATRPGKISTVWKDTDTLWLRKTFNLTQYDFEASTLQFYLAHSGSITVYVNGKEVYSSSSAMSEYTIVTVSQERDEFVLGENVIAVKVTGNSSGRYFGLSLRALPPTSEGSVIDTRVLVNKGAEWTYFVSASDDFGESGAWTGIDFNTSAWKKANAPLGARATGVAGSDWCDETPYIWARYEFNVDDPKDLAKVNIHMNAWFDDEVVVYINGTEIFRDSGWNDGYTNYDIDAHVNFVSGKNVIAVRLHQHSGGYEWDAEIVADIMDSSVLSSNAPVSFEGIGIYASRMQKYFPLSYLVLTGSKPSGGVEWISEVNNRYTRYISTMSQCEVLGPKSAGSTVSLIIRKLRQGHVEGLSKEEIAAISCWIDLAVPCFGSYSPEGNTEWDNGNEREAIEESNKRHVYEVLDKYAKLDRGDVLPEGEIKVEYRSQSATGNGYAILYTDTGIRVGSTIKVTLPEGVHYFGLMLNSRLGEAVIYTPNSTFEMTIPNDFIRAVPQTFTSMNCSTIMARIVTDDELNMRRNLAYNPHDLAANQNAFPHVEASTTLNGQTVYAGRNVIDGFVANLSKGEYPTQAWEPGTLSDSDYLTINYGREVTLDELIILMRCASGDTYFTSCTVEFSDGTEIVLSMKQSQHEQHFDIGSVTTTYVKFKNFVKAEDDKTVAITEIQTMGVDKLG